MEKAGLYGVKITSQRCVGTEGLSFAASIRLTPESQIDRDFEVKRAARIRLQIVDEESRPVKNVQAHIALWSADPHLTGIEGLTDSKGMVTLTVTPSPEKRFVATIREGYAFAHLDVVLHDPVEIAEKTIVLHKGKEVKGVARCTDGKPAAGWRILAMPTWWHLGTTPMGTMIQPDGSFTLPNVIPDKYNLTISIPLGPQMSTSVQVLANAELPIPDKQLAVTLDYPSPGLLTPLTGKVECSDELLGKSIRIHATSWDGKYRGADYLSLSDDIVNKSRPSKREFRLGPLPPGVYRIEFRQGAALLKEIEEVAVPCLPMDVKLD
jgi:hypothetical protein